MTYSNTDLVKLSNIKFRYPNSVSQVLEFDKLEVNKNEKVFLFGPSGSGKTTLLEILAGVIIPQDGKVEILNRNLVQMSLSERDQLRASEIGYIFQNFNLIPYLSVGENITLPLYLSKQRMVKVKDLYQQLNRIVQHLGLSDFLNKKVTELSIGQQQRVAAARAIIGAPSLILADEPTSALDYDHREKFIKLLFEECEENKTSIIFVSHDRTLEKLFDRSISIFDLQKGKQQ